MHGYETFARRIRRFGLCLAAAGSISGVANADDIAANGADPCTESSAARDPEAARVAFRAGQTAFSEGGYARAVELWKQAYGDDCTAHALLLNLAMAEELLGRPNDAIHTLTLFNKRSPGSPYVDANVKRIQRLQLDAADGARGRATYGRELGAPVDRPTSDDERFEMSLPLVVSVAGGAVAAVGAVLFFTGRASAASAEERCRGPRQACGDVEGAIDGERARARTQVGGWMTGAGLVATAGGLVWHFLVDAPRPLDQRASGGVAVSADVPSKAASVTWSGAF